MSEQEEIMDNLLNVDLEIIDIVRDLRAANWDSDSLKQQVGDLLKIRDEMVEKLISFTGHDAQRDCRHDHQHQ